MEQMKIYKDFVGELKAVYRRSEIPSVKVTSSQHAVDFMRPYFDECMDDHEEIKVLHLSRSNGVVNVHHVSSGSDSQSIVPVKDIMRNAILIKTSGIILFHNHPSGNLQPSSADKGITQKLKEACKLMDISLLDHIILTREWFFSFQDEGIF